MSRRTTAATRTGAPSDFLSPPFDEFDPPAKYQ